MPELLFFETAYGTSVAETQEWLETLGFKTWASTGILYVLNERGAELMAELCARPGSVSPLDVVKDRRRNVWCTIRSNRLIAAADDGSWILVDYYYSKAFLAEEWERHCGALKPAA